MTDLSNIIAVVGADYSDSVMMIAKKHGARGGTVIGASGSVDEKAAKLYGVDVRPDREIVMLLVKTDLCEAILRDLYAELGLSSPACGIFFTMKVTAASENLLRQYEEQPADEATGREGAEGDHNEGKQDNVQKENANDIS
ncbi:MAG: hypothetical protein K5647_10405 [Clostridiales bacterium]|nr:hypothetical protein [Clostridiales bacterium]